MRNKISVIVLGLLALVFVGGLMGGCGSTSVTSYTYFYPDWTPDGKIICSKLQSTSTSGGNFLGMPGGTTFNDHYFLTVMDANGSNEADIKEISGSAKVAASPLGNYYAYTDGNNITIITTAGVTANTIDCGATVDSFDWGPDESNLVFGTKTSATSEIYVVDRAGTLSSLLTIGENVAWRFGDKIVFEYVSGIYTYTATINQDGTNRENLDREDRVISPQFFSSDTNKIYGSQGTKYGYVDISLTSKDFTELFSDFDGYLPKLSKSADTIVYTDYSDVGIWVINISGTGEVQLR